MEKTEELCHALKDYRWDVVGLCEVRWTSFGEVDVQEGHKIYYSGKETDHQHGVGFIVNKKILNCVLRATPVSSRIMSLRLSAQPLNINVVQVYAPSSDFDDDIVEEFYEDRPYHDHGKWWKQEMVRCGFKGKITSTRGHYKTRNL